MSDENFPVLNFHEFVAADGDRITTDSRKVAAVFGKRHDHVLRDIDRILAQVPDFFGKPNFGETEYVITNNLGFAVKERRFEMTKDGFTLLAMGFTGKRALQFKLAYIQAFNDMAAYIKNQREGLQMRYFEKALEHKHKKDRASFHGRGLNEWRQEKPTLETALSQMLEEMQPGLPFGGLLN